MTYFRTQHGIPLLFSQPTSMSFPKKISSHTKHHPVHHIKCQWQWQKKKIFNWWIRIQPHNNKYFSVAVRYKCIILRTFFVQTIFGPLLELKVLYYNDTLFIEKLKCGHQLWDIWGFLCTSYSQILKLLLTRRKKPSRK